MDAGHAEGTARLGRTIVKEYHTDKCSALARGVRNRLSGIPEVTPRSALNLTLHLTFVDDRVSALGQVAATYSSAC